MSANMKSDKKTLSISKLNGLIKQNRNADFKKIVSSFSQSHLINIGGKILMHVAAIRGNIDIIKFLFDLGLDIDAQNKLGQTPLHLALLNKRFQAAQLLLTLDPDILLADGKGNSALQMCFQEERDVPEYIISRFLERLKRTDISAHQKAVELENVGCSIRQVLLMGDAEVIGFMLDRKTSIDEDESHDLLECSMSSGCPDGVRALVTRGPGSNKRLETILTKVLEHINERRMRFYLQKLISWDVITKDFVQNVAATFELGDESEIKIYLHIGIDEYARKKFDRELLVSLFYNNKIDCIEMIKNKQLDMNRLGMTESSALHMAARKSNIASIVYLLEKSADPNIRDSDGQTPLFKCLEDETAELLLEAGADIQAIDNEGFTILEYTYRDRIVAELCILEERGLLKQELSDAMKNNSGIFLPRKLLAYRSDLNWMKTRNILKSVISLFTLLFEKVEDMARYVKNEADVADVLEVSRERQLQPVYVSMLTKKLRKAAKVNELRPRAAVFLSRVMKINQTDHLVIEKIITFLNYRNLLVFDKIDFD